MQDMQDGMPQEQEQNNVIKWLCTECREIKIIDNFPKTKYSKTGYKQPCKLCGSLRSKEYYRKHKDAIRAKQKDYAATHKEYRREYIKNRRIQLQNKDAAPINKSS